MKFGLSMPTTGFARETEPVDGGAQTRWRRTFEICELAEQLGFDLVSIGHHRFTVDRIDSPQPLTTLAALAARTTQLRFCTNIAILPLHHPIDIAEQVAMVDEMSGGRIMLGAAIGYRPYEFEQIGLDYKQRVSRFEEAVGIVRQAWSEEPVFFEGKHFKVHGADVRPKPFQRPGPPIWIGGQAAAAVSRAARLGDGWLTDNIEGAVELGPKIAKFREESHAAGHAGTVVLNRKIGIDRDRLKIEEVWLPPILEVYRQYLKLGVPFDSAFAEDLTSGKSLRLDDIPSDRIIAGTPEDCIAGIRTCITETNCDYLIVDFGRAAHGSEFKNIRDQISLFGREVMPHFS